MKLLKLIEQIHRGYELEPTGFDPELNKYSSRVVPMPITRLLDQLKQATVDMDNAIRAYPDYNKEMNLIKKDIKALHREITKFAEDKKLK